ncbi:hypothetical protein Q1Z72_13780 [Pseudomonas qingdaonensis]|uniref:HIRAN domain-containing protein n=1 Tax=Pseudomonas qingdaonensis TaxID=2056231 RepID=UPI0026602617|nr:HIRAN domain-containing protein [Pseudomonas qingdaonensis]WKL69677.1 hypothetical protein Q1Z72_13780 [Pseudomonas qingdaonensis]
MSSAFVVWQDPETTMWEPVAKLTETDGVFKFSYTRGALNKRFVGFPRMDQLNKEYSSNELFPFFQNRLIPDRRPEYYSMLTWLDMLPGESKPIEILSASGGSRKTDNFRIVKVPERTEVGEYRLKFFISGVAYLSDELKHEVSNLVRGAELSCALQPSNSADPNAVIIINSSTNNSIGYYPRYLNEDLIRLNKACGVESHSLITRVNVVKVNCTAPEQYRVLCESVTPWPQGFLPFQSDKYKLLVEEI